MMSRWCITLERVGLRQTRLNCYSPVATFHLPSRHLSSDVVFPTITSGKGKGSSPATQEQDLGVFYLTQLFGKLLKLGEESNASRLIRDMKSLDSPVTIVVCNYLLNSCSKNRNSKMAKEVWNFMQSNRIRMNKVSYGCLIGSLSRGGCLDEAIELLNLLAKNNQANLVMYNTVLNGCVHTKSKVQAERSIELMEEQGVLKDERTYVELIKLSGMLGDLRATKRWWTQLLGDFSPSSTGHSSYIIALCRMNDLTAAREALQDMVSACGSRSTTHLIPPHGRTTQRTKYFSNELPLFRERQAFIEGENGAVGGPSVSYGSKVLVIEDLHPDSYDEGHLAVSEFDTKNTQQLDESQRTLSPGDDEDETTLFTQDVEVPGFPAELSSRGMKLSDVTSAGLKELQNAYNALINAAGKARNHVLAECLFSEMRQLGLKLDIYTYNALLRAVVEGRGVKHGLRILKRMDTTRIKPDFHSLTTLLEGYCRERKFSKAHAVLDYMESGSQSQRPSCHTYNTFLNACVSAVSLLLLISSVDKVFTMGRNFNTRARYDLGSPESICLWMVLRLCEMFQERNEILMIWMVRLTQEDSERALHVFGRMKEFGVAPDICTYIALFTVMGNTRSEPEGSSPWSQQQVAKRVTAIELDMAQSGVRHTRESFTSLMHVLGAQGLTELMLERLKDANSDGEEILDVTSYNTVILSCVNLNQVETAWKVSGQMKTAGLKPDVYTYNILINGCTHERKLTTAFELVDKMRQDGLTPDIVTFNTLLKVVCHSEEMDLVFDLLKQMTDSGVQPDTATFNTILTSASYQKRIDLIEHMVEEMRRRNLLPDHHTFLPVVSTYMQAGQTEDAVEALRVLSFRMLESNKPLNEAGTMQRKQVQGVIADLARKNLSLGMDTRELLKDAVLHTSTEALAIYTGALSGLVQGDLENSETEGSFWAARLSAQYDKRKASGSSKLS